MAPHRIVPQTNLRRKIIMRKTSLALTIASAVALSALVAACNTTGTADGATSSLSSMNVANGISKGVGDTGHSVN
jgi:hypothetical protein